MGLSLIYPFPPVEGSHINHLHIKNLYMKLCFKVGSICSIIIYRTGWSYSGVLLEVIVHEVRLIWSY